MDIGRITKEIEALPLEQPLAPQPDSPMTPDPAREVPADPTPALQPA